MSPINDLRTTIAPLIFIMYYRGHEGLAMPDVSGSSNSVGGNLFRNLFLAHSTPQNYMSLRTGDGSPFILTFCEVLRQNWMTLNVMDLFNEVADQVKIYHRVG